MNQIQSYRTALLLLALAVVCLGAFWKAAAVPASGPAPASAPEAPPAPPPAPHLLDPLPRAAVLEGAAGDLRQHRCAAALDAAAAAGAADPARRAFITTVEGLYAHACEDVQRAFDRLSAVPSSRPPGSAAPLLEDWRLLVLADSALALDRPAVAREALDRLLDTQPASPLRPRAYLKAVRLAADATGSGPGAALDLVRRARREGISGEEGAALEVLAWELGQSTGDAVVRAEAARRLLVHHPLRAEELAVQDLAGAAGAAGPLPATQPLAWIAVLSPEERALRARNLLDADRPQAAGDALAAIPRARRDLEWYLLTARALTGQQDGLAALQLLAGPGFPAAGLSPGERARVEWHRAQAAFEAARARRGRDNLPSDQRQRLRDQARRHLAAAAGPGADRKVAERALGRLFVELWEEERVEDALAVLTRLREIDPQDLTGTRALWQAGWSEFAGRNPSGAVGYWSELISLYPESAYSRNGRYWTARAHEELGNAERAGQIYREVMAAETGDFYTPYARERLRVLSGSAGVRPAAANPLAQDRGIPWPRHDDLHRARLLTDLGLDSLALSEMEAVGAASSGEERDEEALRRRAAQALEALILARQGDVRTSIRRIHDAFPSLGGPLQGTVPMEALRLYYPVAHGELIRQNAQRRSLPPHLVFGMVRQESGFDTDAVSRAGAQGLMQLMPATSREVAGKLGLRWSRSRLSEPEFNVTLGTAYFRQVLSMFDGDVELALAGYNGGPYRIKRLWSEAPDGQERDLFLEGLPVPESRMYVKRILLLADSYRQLYPAMAGSADTPVTAPAGAAR